MGKVSITGEIHLSAKEREYKHWDELQVVMFVIFAASMVVEGFFSMTTFLGEFIDGWVRFGAGSLVATGGGLMIAKSHGAVFGKDHEPPKCLLTSGLFARLRHPMYAGIMLLYTGGAIGLFSIIMFAMLAGYAVIYDKMASYEEKKLLAMFGDKYREYQRRVPKWFPRIEMGLRGR